MAYTPRHSIIGVDIDGCDFTTDTELLPWVHKQTDEGTERYQPAVVHGVKINGVWFDACAMGDDFIEEMEYEIQRMPLNAEGDPPSAPAAPSAEAAGELPPLPEPTGWITNPDEFKRSRNASVYGYCWRPDAKPHPHDMALFTADQMRAYARAALRAVGAGVDATNAARYEWLRDNVQWQEGIRPVLLSSSGDQLDAAIDAARARADEGAAK